MDSVKVTPDCDVILTEDLKNLEKDDTREDKWKKQNCYFVEMLQTKKTVDILKYDIKTMQGGEQDRKKVMGVLEERGKENKI